MRKYLLTVFEYTVAKKAWLKLYATAVSHDFWEKLNLKDIDFYARLAARSLSLP